MTKRPNVLLFITDQQRADHVGAYGNPVLQTPNLDALAEKGWRSERFYVASPICMPNRSSLMTGRMPSVHGARHNGIPLSLQANTFVDRLKDSGYATALVGKSHLQNMTGKGPVWPPASAPKTEGEAFLWPEGNYDQEWGPLWRNDPNYELDSPFYGFERVDLAVDHGDQVWGHYWRWLQKNHPEVAKVAGPEHALPSPEFELTQHRQAWRTRVPEELSTNAYLGQRTRELIKEYSAEDQPFFIMCSFPDPHHPFTPHGKYWDMYDPADVNLPASFHASKEHPASPPVAWLHEQRAQGKAVTHTPAVFSCTEREAREAIALNYGSITHIDAVIGEVLQELKDQNLDQDTIIIFMSDHGDYLGDHRLLLKGPIHFQSVIRTPFIWYDPQQPTNKNHSDQLASTIDVAPTLLERLGVTPYNGIQGRSLLPIIQNREEPWREQVLIEEEGQRVMFGFDGRVRMRTLIEGNYRLSVYEQSPWGELYDLGNDPDELINLWDKPEHAELKTRLLHSLGKTMIAYADTSPNPTALA